MNDTSSIVITTTQDGEMTTWESEGMLTKIDDKYIITYPDYASNTETDNKLEIDTNKMYLKRSGAFTSEMLFQENMLTVGTYNVMYYNSDIEVFTKEYSCQDEEEELQVHIAYQLLESGREITSNVMKVTIVK